MRIKILDGLFAIFLFLPLRIFASNFVVFDENILNEKVKNEIKLIGSEIYDKTGIFVGVAIGDATPFEILLTKQKELPPPYILLALSRSSHKVDIAGTKDALAFFDREAVLSPFAGTGTILPILASQKGDIYNAAILNGYGDICDRLARYFHLDLEHSIGNANRDTLNIMRILLYGFICFALLYFFQRRRKIRA